MAGAAAGALAVGAAALPPLHSVVKFDIEHIFVAPHGLHAAVPGCDFAAYIHGSEFQEGMEPDKFGTVLERVARYNEVLRVLRTWCGGVHGVVVHMDPALPNDNMYKCECSFRMVNVIMANAMQQLAAAASGGATQNWLPPLHSVHEVDVQKIRLVANGLYVPIPGYRASAFCHGSEWSEGLEPGTLGAEDVQWIIYMFLLQFMKSFCRKASVIIVFVDWRTSGDYMYRCECSFRMVHPLTGVRLQADDYLEKWAQSIRARYKRLPHDEVGQDAAVAEGVQLMRQMLAQGGQAASP